MTLTPRSHAAEQMDAADLDVATYAALLADLARVNALLRADRPTIGFIRRAAGQRRHLRVLDVGYGHGDMLRAIAGWAKRHGIDVDLVGVDLNPRSEAIARAATPAALAIDYRTGDYAALAGEGFDLIVSSLVAHHMDDAELVAFLRFMEGEARLGWMVNDLRRSTFAFRTYPWLARAMGWHRIVREDGTLSIARSFREDDWQRLIALAGLDAPAESAPRIVRRLGFRLCVERIR